MFTPYRSLTHLLVTAGEVRGRKKLQKMVFIAQRLGYPFAEPFDLHVWGPYSEVLALKLKEMTDWGFAHEEVLPGPAGNHQYVYAPGRNASLALGAPSESDSARDRLAGLISHLNEQDATFLEGVATVLYLKSKGLADQAVCDRLVRLKPDKFAEQSRVHAVLAFANDLDFYRHDG
ncbi:MAG TPA: hypothetical protein VD969_14295 [Symbiobacteriaceae bacterium]|nr:hypothetical protein [Symbiobacteriaceae bacterium]